MEFKRIITAVITSCVITKVFPDFILIGLFSYFMCSSPVASRVLNHIENIVMDTKHTSKGLKTQCKKVLSNGSQCSLKGKYEGYCGRHKSDKSDKTTESTSLTQKVVPMMLMNMWKNWTTSKQSIEDDVLIIEH